MLYAQYIHSIYTLLQYSIHYTIHYYNIVYTTHTLYTHPAHPSEHFQQPEAHFDLDLNNNSSSSSFNKIVVII